MKMHRNLIWTLLLGTSLFFFQCKSSEDDVMPDDENELITTVSLQFTEQGTSTVHLFTYKDTDGEGGNAATQFDTIVLKPNTNYKLDIELLDESKTPSENITEDVEEKSDEHLFIYTAAPAALLTYTYGDKDDNNFGIGLTGSAVTGIAGAGKLKVQLRHQPETKNGTSGPGSDDVNLDFNLLVR